MQAEIDELRVHLTHERMKQLEVHENHMQVMVDLEKANRMEQLLDLKHTQSKHDQSKIQEIKSLHLLVTELRKEVFDINVKNENLIEVNRIIVDENKKLQNDLTNLESLLTSKEMEYEESRKDHLKKNENLKRELEKLQNDYRTEITEHIDALHKLQIELNEVKAQLEKEREIKYKQERQQHLECQEYKNYLEFVKAEHASLKGVTKFIYYLVFKCFFLGYC